MQGVGILGKRQAVHSIECSFITLNVREVEAGLMTQVSGTQQKQVVWQTKTPKVGILGKRQAVYSIECSFIMQEASEFEVSKTYKNMNVNARVFIATYSVHNKQDKFTSCTTNYSSRDKVIARQILRTSNMRYANIEDL